MRSKSTGEVLISKELLHSYSVVECAIALNDSSQDVADDIRLVQILRRRACETIGPIQEGCILRSLSEGFGGGANKFTGVVCEAL